MVLYFDFGFLLFGDFSVGGGFLLFGMFTHFLREDQKDMIY